MIPYRYITGAVLLFSPGVVLWLGRPEYFGYLEANYFWLSGVGLMSMCAGAWLCAREFSAAQKRS
jgi:hypothetical protein